MLNTAEGDHLPFLGALLSKVWEEAADQLDLRRQRLGFGALVEPTFS